MLAGDVKVNPGPPRNFTLNLGHINARSLNSDDKFDEICSIAHDVNLDILAISETWLNDSISSDTLNIQGFAPIIRLDRQDGRRAGSVALFLSSNIACKRRLDLENWDFEMLFVEFKISNTKFVCGVCYRPPNYSVETDLALLNHLQNCLDKIYLQPNTFVVLLGDFNAHFDMSSAPLSSDFGACLHSWMGCNNLYQVIKEPTRVTSHSATLLDLIITNYPGYFVFSDVLSPPSGCDHSFVYARINISLEKPKCYKRHIWDFSKIDYTVLHANLLNINFEEICMITDNIDDLYCKWYEKFCEALEISIPNRIVTICPRDKPWMNSDIRKAIRKRNRLMKFYCRHKSSGAWENYRVQKNLTTLLIRTVKVKYYANLSDKLQDPEIGHKRWWGIIKSLYGNKIHSNIPTLLEGDQMITDAKEKAKLFNDYFCSVCQIENGDAALPSIPPFQNFKHLANISTSEQEINILLRNVDLSKACGSDGIGNFILKICADFIAVPLCRIINESLLEGVYPSMWKLANVIPIFKKDDRQCKVNYRPVSLLACLSKISEKIVFTRLYNFLLDIDFLNPFQSGFRPGDSTINQLILITHKIYEALEQGKEVRMVFLDKVWHKGLLYKLERIGVRDPLLKWFKTYLTGRKQRVTIDGQSSDWSEIKAGVPQALC